MELSYFGFPLLLPPGLSTSIYDETDLAGDGKPFLILNYANGPGFYSHRVERLQEVPRRNLTGEDSTGQFVLNTYVQEFHTYSSAIMADVLSTTLYSIVYTSAIMADMFSTALYSIYKCFYGRHVQYGIVQYIHCICSLQ